MTKDIWIEIWDEDLTEEKAEEARKAVAEVLGIPIEQIELRWMMEDEEED